MDHVLWSALEPNYLWPEMLVEEAEKFLLSVFRFRDLTDQVLHVVAVSLPIVDMEIGQHARLAKCAVHSDGVAEEQVASSGNQDRRWEAFQITIDR